MIRIAPWEVAGIEVRPLTVRERIVLSEELADDRARKAGEDAVSIGMTKAEALKHIAVVREESRAASTIVIDAFTPSGAMRVLSRACGAASAEQLAAAVSLDELSMVAAAALGIDIEAHAERVASGKAAGRQ
jgi:hypothetical protein